MVVELTLAVKGPYSDNVLVKQKLWRNPAKVNNVIRTYLSEMVHLGFGKSQQVYSIIFCRDCSFRFTCDRGVFEMMAALLPAVATLLRT